MAFELALHLLPPLVMLGFAWVLIYGLGVASEYPDWSPYMKRVGAGLAVSFLALQAVLWALIGIQFWGAA